MLTQYYFHVMNYLHDLAEREEGQDLSEYAILVGIVAVIVIAIILTVGGQINNIFSKLSSVLTRAGG